MTIWICHHNLLCVNSDIIWFGNNSHHYTRHQHILTGHLFTKMQRNLLLYSNFLRTHTHTQIHRTTNLVYRNILIPNRSSSKQHNSSAYLFIIFLGYLKTLFWVSKIDTLSPNKAPPLPKLKDPYDNGRYYNCLGHHTIWIVDIVCGLIITHTHTRWIKRF